MDKYIVEFQNYLTVENGCSTNTIDAYSRDIKKLYLYLEEQSVNDIKDIHGTHLNGFILNLEKEQRATTTISRIVATMRRYFRFLEKQNIIDHNPSEMINGPKISKKVPSYLSLDEIECLLEQPGKDNKGLRDKAMLELLYATGIRVSELVALEINDINLNLSFIHCNTQKHDRIIPFGRQALKALNLYINNARPPMLKDKASDLLFVNCYGNQMTRQGFWKVIKSYASKADINTTITPHILRHSFAKHLIQNGANLKAVQEMMGHIDISSTQAYISKEQNKINDVYKLAHPRA